MTSQQSDPRRAAAHTSAVERLDAALGEQEQRIESSDAAHGTKDELHAGVQLAAANEQVAARQAWLSYVEQGY